MKSANLYRSILNNLNDGVYFVNLDRQIIYWNKAAEEISGYSAEEVIGKDCGSNLLNHIDVTGKPLCIVGCPLYASMIDGKQRKDEVFLRHKSGHRVPVLVNIFPVTEDGKIIGAAEVFTPNSPVVYDDDLIEQLSNMAMRDALTGLVNRRYMQSFVEFKINEMRRFNALTAVLFMDIDNFSAVNNTHGHDVGDDVLKKITESIKKYMRKSDKVGRWGGEEFVGVYVVKDTYEAPIIAEKVRMLVANTETGGENPVSVTASIGITMIHPEDTVDSVIERADRLMYESKKSGKNKVTSDC